MTMKNTTHTGRAGRTQVAAWTPKAPAGVSELRIRIGGVEIAVAGESREECFRKLLAEAARVDEGRVGK